MPEIAEITESYFADFTRRERRAAWLEPLRERAMERFGELGFPTTRLEDWRFTNVAPLTRTPFKMPSPVADGVTERNLDAARIEEVAALLVFVDGVFEPEFSRLRTLPAGVRAASLRDAWDSPGKSLQGHMARHADTDRNAFVALNTAMFQDGALIEIANGVVLDKPVHVLFVRAPNARGTVTHPRVLVVTGRDAQVKVIESHVGSAGAAYFTNAVTELVAGENSSVEHLKLQEEGDEAFHIGMIHSHQERSSRFVSHSVSLGARLARHDIISVMAGEGAECTLNGLYQAGGNQHVDHHTRLDHAMPHCASREYYRGILDGKSSGVFNGAIIVRKDAQKTDAIQSNKNLLLSEEATINTKPELQILADDVRCTHGATVGQLNADALFYLRARGIGFEAARHLLTRAFANDVLSRVTHIPARERLEAKLLARLSAGWKPEEVL